MLENQDFGSAEPIASPRDVMPTALSAAEAARWAYYRGTPADGTPPLIVGSAVLVMMAVVAVATLAALFAPYVYAELFPELDPHSIVSTGTPILAKGRMVDDYWAVQKIDSRTYAIGEPRYYQGNYTYLLLGSRRALLFDSGSGTRNIRPIVERLTSLPVTVMPSHLHYDHLGGIRAFSSVAMIDLPQTRRDVRHGVFRPSRYEFLGFSDGRRPPAFHVTQWLKPGARIDLGGRTLEVIHTPGHTATSAALFDPAAHQLFSGDFVYPTTLYAFLPGASLSAYRRTADMLLASLPPDTTIWAAHCCRVGERPSAPWLTMADVRDLDRALDSVATGHVDADGFYPRFYPVNDQMELATGFFWNNR